MQYGSSKLNDDDDDDDDDENIITIVPVMVSKYTERHQCIQDK